MSTNSSPPPSKPKRKLAAILFADIAGYTSMMEKDESSSRIALNKFQECLKESIEEHHGKIVHFYGDGCLAMFESSVDAVYSAQSAQSIFREEPIVPVRIGIHSGDVFLDKDSIYGDSVNIASRIESIGIPGSVLFSESVRRHIKNHQEFQIASLGSVAFKNIEQPLEIYALANTGFPVPDPTSLTGKLQESSPKPIRQTYRKLFSLIGICLIVITGILIWKLNTADLVLPTEVREARIAVLPFENKTNNQELDIAGDMAADWIIEGLMNLDEIKVVSFQNIKSNLQYASFNQLDQANDLFHKITGAEKIIQGNFYQVEEDLTFKSKIIDATTGEFELALPDVTGSKDDISQIIRILQSKILGYFAASKHNFASLFKDNPPKYDAYKEFVLGGNQFGVDNNLALAHFNNAIHIDSLYFWPYNAIVITYTNQGNYAAGDSVVQIVSERFEHLTKFEQLYHDFALATIDRDLYKLGTISKALFDRDPKNPLNNYLAGYYKANVNRPAEAITIFEAIDTSTIQNIITNRSDSWRNEAYAHCLIRLDRPQEALKVLKWVKPEFRNRNNYQLQAVVYALQKSPEKIQSLIRDLETEGKSAAYISSIYHAAAVTYGLLRDESKQKQWGEVALKYLQNQPESNQMDEFAQAESYYLAGKYEKALDSYSRTLASGSSGSVYGVGSWHYLSRIGCIYAKLGHEARALYVIEELKNFSDPTPSGRYTYGMARVYAQMGEKEKATELLKKAMNEGFINEYAEFRYGEDIDLIPLHGNPVFDEFVLQRN